jgi:hypothetical protein
MVPRALGGKQLRLSALEQPHLCQRVVRAPPMVCDAFSSLQVLSRASHIRTHTPGLRPRRTVQGHGNALCAWR